MNRRTFLNQSVKASLAVGLPMVTSATAIARSPKANGTITVETVTAGSVQSERGVVIHPYESLVMKGSPPADEMLVTRETMNEAKFAVWQNQHNRGLFPTQRIWRGRGPISTFARPNKVEEIQHAFDEMVIQTNEGDPLTVKEYLRRQNISAFLAMKLAPSGQAVILNEQYFLGMRPETVHQTYSAFKPLQGALAAIAIAEGLLDPDCTIQNIIPELHGTAYHGVTLRQVLDMRSGVGFEMGLSYNQDETLDVDLTASDFVRGDRSMDPSPDPTVPKGYYAFLATLERQHQPGTVFHYSNADLNVAVWAAEKAFRKRFADAFSEQVYQRLGPEEDAQIGCDWVGNPTRSPSISLRDFARWGEMVLQRGWFRGKRIISSRVFDEIDRADPKQIENTTFVPGFFPVGSKYCYYFVKLPDDCYCHMGAFGQLLLVDPPRRQVIAHFSAGEIIPTTLPVVRQMSAAMERFECI